MQPQNRLNELDKAPIGKLLFKYSLPSVVGMVVMSLYNIIDRMFIGQGVGPDAIAGLAITFPVMNISAAFGVLIGGGAGARTSIVLGQGKKRTAELILGNSLVMTLVFGTFYIGLFAIFMDEVLILFGASKTSLPYARDFMMYILPGLMFNNLTFSFCNIMRATGYPKKAMWANFIGAGLNVILAPIFIFGLKWGIKGAAIATDLSMLVSMIYVQIHFFSPKSEIHYSRGIYRLSAAILLPIIAVGAAPCIVNTAGCVINAILNNTVFKYGGDSSVAAMGIFMTFSQLAIMFVIGVCMGMQPIVGFNYGAKRFDRLKRAYWLTVGVSTIVCFLATIASVFFPKYVAMIFTTDSNLIAACEHAMPIANIVFWIAGFQIVTTNFFQSLGEATKSIFMSLSRQVIFLLPFLLILPPIFKLDGVWYSFPVSDLLAALIGMVLLIIEMRKINRLVASSQAT
ncbi:MAG: MATE family efflux transporter [Muribaculaceae bacterium]|nr:MATE family efflux transporter [Muribaculaceae bacterium]MBQ9585490.1 MATE family efflux transporter [Muribaculaceae bacterium]